MNGARRVRERRRWAALAAITALALAPGAGMAQTGDAPVPPPVRYPALAAQASEPAGFVPPGWALEDDVRGDLDGDGVADAVLVLHQSDPANILDNVGLGESRIDTNPRLLAVVFARGDGWHLAEANHALIPRWTDPRLDPPYEKGSVAIERGAFRVSLGFWSSAGSWTMEDRSLRFRWRGGRFELIGFDSVETNRATGEIRRVSINLLTRRAVVGDGRIEDSGWRERRTTLPPGEPAPLGGIGDGLAFDPGLRA